MTMHVNRSPQEARKMYSKGYSYLVEHVSEDLAPLYVGTIEQVVKLIFEVYPTIKFKIYNVYENGEIGGFGYDSDMISYSHDGYHGYPAGLVE